MESVGRIRDGGAIPARKGREDEALRWSSWMRSAQAGDDAAYRSLIAELYECVERYVGRMLPGEDAVHDCVQDALLAVHQARHTYDPARPFHPWLFTIVRHKVIDQLRRRRPELPLAEAPEPTSPPSDPSSRLDLVRLLGILPLEYREAVLLTYIEGLSSREAGRVLGISSIAVRSRVHRGLTRVRAAMAPERSSGIDATTSRTPT